MRRNKRARESRGAVYESGGSQVVYHDRREPQELGGDMITYKQDAVEIEQPPVELAGREMGLNDTGRRYEERNRA